MGAERGAGAAGVAAPTRAPAAAALLVAASLLGACASGPNVTSSDVGGDPQAEPAWSLAFEGNVLVSAGTLRAELEGALEQLEEEGFRKSDVDDLAYEAERLYREMGYHFARVDYEYSPEHAVVRIDEGPRVALGAIGFTGNVAFTREKLIEELEVTHAGTFGLGGRLYVESEVEQFQSAIERLYLERGYQDVEVKEPATVFSATRETADVHIEIAAGPQYVVRDIVFERLSELDRISASDRLAYLIGSAYVPRLQLEVESAINSLYLDDARPDATTTVTTSMEPEGAERVAVRFSVESRPGPQVKIERVVVVGNDRTSERFIRSRVLLEAGDPYNGQLERRSFRRLFQTGLFRRVDIRLRPSPAGTDADGRERRDLVVEIDEQGTLEAFVELGFGSYDLARARIGARELNLFGQGIIGRAELLGSIRGAEATLGLTDPWVLGSEWTADLPLTALYREEPSFSIEEYGAGFRLSRPLLASLSGGLAYRFSVSTIDDFTIESVDEEEANLRLAAAGPFLEYDSRDDIFVPTRGWRWRAFGEVGSPSLGGEISFLHGGASLAAYYELFPGTVIAGAARTEWIVPFDDTGRIPIQERLFNGGENSVRSFRESELGPEDVNGKPLGGEVSNLLSVELRQQVWEEFSFAVFFDYGNVAITDDRPLADFRPGVGFGLRYNLPIGPIRADFGFNPHQRSEEDLFAFHVAVGMPW